MVGLRRLPDWGSSLSLRTVTAACRGHNKKAPLRGLVVALGCELILLQLLTALVLHGLIADYYADAASYIEGTRRVLAGKPLYTAMQLHPYALQDAANGAGYLYPPSASLILGPLALGDLVVTAWNVGALVVPPLVAAAIVRRERGSWTSTLWVVALLVTVLGSDVNVGQASPYIAALFGLMWLAPRWSGWLSVLGAAVKAQPIVGLVWARRSRAPLWPPLVALLLVVGITTMVVPGGGWTDWLIATRNGYADCPAGSLPSLSCYGLGWVSWLLAAVALIGAVRIRDDAAAFALLGLAAFLAAPEIYPSRLLLPLIAALPWLLRPLPPAPQVDLPVADGARPLPAVEDVLEDLAGIHDDDAASGRADVGVRGGRERQHVGSQRIG